MKKTLVDTLEQSQLETLACVQEESWDFGLAAFMSIGRRVTLEVLGRALYNFNNTLRSVDPGKIWCYSPEVQGEFFGCVQELACTWSDVNTILTQAKERLARMKEV
jgi:hypothetical protein